MKHWEWLEGQLTHARPGCRISPFGKTVAQIIGTTWKGIYHLPQSSYLHPRTQWDHDGFIELIIPDQGIATWDFNQLTTLVVLCHDYCIRMQLDNAGMRHLKLRFHKRAREGGVGTRHPTMEEAINDPEHNWRPTEEEVRG